MLALLKWLLFIKGIITLRRICNRSKPIQIKKEIISCNMNCESHLKESQKENYLNLIPTSIDHTNSDETERPLWLTSPITTNSVSNPLKQKTFRKKLCTSKLQDLNITIHDLLIDLDSVFFEASKNPGNKEKLLKGLRCKTRSYQIKVAAFQIFVSDLIEMESQNKCSIHLSAEELESLWKRQV